MKKLFLFIAVAFFSLPLKAAEFSPYIGFDAGFMRVGYSDDYFKKISGNSQFNFTINGGGKFNRYFGLELSAALSTGREKKSQVWGGFSYVSQKTELRYMSLGLDAVGYLPLDRRGFMLYNRKVNLLAYAGIGQYIMKAKFKGHLTNDDSASSLGARFGLGFEYNVDSNFAWRFILGIAVVDLDDVVDEIGEIKTGVKYKF